mmetsp:Transcript_9306/g.13208  ORF Transcript_9306/g.13208 Transcript_9306/m.13208 type:complete len:230 (+) Transcript_9306:975-1664(+)
MTVGGSWQGSPSKTNDRQLLVDITGIRFAGSTLWHASSTITKGIDNGGRLSGAKVCLSGFCSDLPDFLPVELSISSSLEMIPHAASRRASAAPIEVQTTTSASRSAFVAAILHASIDAFTALVAMSCEYLSLAPAAFAPPGMPPFVTCIRVLSCLRFEVDFNASSKAFCATGSLSIAASSVCSQIAGETAEGLPTRITLRPSWRSFSARLSAPVLLKAHASTLLFDMDI